MSGVNDTYRNVDRPSHSDGTTAISYDSLYNLSQDLSNLLFQSNISDCLIKVDETHMAVHQSVIAARSTVLCDVVTDYKKSPSGEDGFAPDTSAVSRMSSAAKEAIKTSRKNGKLLIDIGFTDPETMKQAIIFMYTGNCEINQYNATKLLRISGYLDIKSLKVPTAQYLVTHINPKNIFELLEVSYKYDNKLLKRKCVEYFIANAKDLTETGELWKNFTKNHPDIIIDLFYWQHHNDDANRADASDRPRSDW